MAQNWQPMHFSLSICTVPSASLWLASVGHTLTQGASAQCWQVMGKKYISTSGTMAPSYLGFGPTRSTLFQKLPMGTSFTALQATLQERQPTHLFRSVMMAY